MKKKKELDTEVDLIAIISLLSGMICSLLLTAVWIQLGSMDVKQAIGGQSAAETEKKPALWARFGKENQLQLQVQDSAKVPSKLRQVNLKSEAGVINFTALEEHITSLKKFEPELQMVLIQPQSETVYEDIISLMDHMRRWGMNDLGVSPL